jgi:hypothetical protein
LDTKIATIVNSSQLVRFFLVADVEKSFYEIWPNSVEPAVCEEFAAEVCGDGSNSKPANGG